MARNKPDKNGNTTADSNEIETISKTYHLQFANTSTVTETSQYQIVVETES